MGKIGRHISFANVTATLALVLAMGGGAIAATGGFASGRTIRGCVNSEGVLRLLKAGKHCAKGQQQIAWNEQGPAGGTGAQGGPGPRGPEGQKGAPGTPGEPADVKWAVVDQFGRLVSGHGAVGAGEGSDNIAVAFDRDITNCGIVATPNGPANLKKAMMTAVPAGTEVDVYMYSPEGNQDLETFTVAVYC